MSELRSRRIFRATADDLPDLDQVVVQSRHEEERQAEEDLARMEREYIGAFITPFACNCGNANITDHAHVPTEISGVLGPQARASDRRDAFLDQIRHGYWCDSCGALYHAQVVEKVRGYVPRERR